VSLLKNAPAWQPVDVTRTGGMSEPVLIVPGREVCVQEVVKLVAGRKVWV